jgi:hypothetical protein
MNKTILSVICPLPDWTNTVTDPYIIRRPYIDKNRHFQAITNLYDSFAAGYNAIVKEAHKNGDRSAQPLRAPHRALFLDIVHLASGQMNRNAYCFKDTAGLIAHTAMEPYSVHTNRVALAKRTKKSESAIYRQILRLADAGVIVQKIGHGTQHDFELLINPLLLPISDHFNEQFDPLEAIHAFTQLQAFPDGLRAKCTPKGKRQEHLKNELITVNIVKESAPPTLYNEHNENIYRNTGRRSEVSEKINDFPPAPAAAPKTPDEVRTSYAEKMRRAEEQQTERIGRFAVMFVEYLIRVLFATHNIYKGERQRAYEVAQYYFRECQTTEQCNVAMFHYQKRIDMVAKYIKRKNFDFSHIYPARYLDPDNTACGFEVTKKWLKKEQAYTEMRKRIKLRRKDEAILQNALTRLYQQPTLGNYMQLQSYIHNYAPDKINDFNKTAAGMFSI